MKLKIKIAINELSLRMEFGPRALGMSIYYCRPTIRINNNTE